MRVKDDDFFPKSLRSVTDYPYSYLYNSIEYSSYRPTQKKKFSVQPGNTNTTENQSGSITAWMNRLFFFPLSRRRFPSRLPFCFLPRLLLRRSHLLQAPLRLLPINQLGRHLEPLNLQQPLPLTVFVHEKGPKGKSTHGPTASF